MLRLSVALVLLPLFCAAQTGSVGSSLVVTAAGPGDCGDGGPATSGWLVSPMSVAADAAGNVYIADFHAHRVRRISPAGVISTVAGTGLSGNGGDGGPAVSARISYPNALAVDSAGNLYIGVSGYLVRKVTADGRIGDFLNWGSVNYGDAIAADAGGNIYISETWNHRVARVNAAGVLTVVAGTGTAGYYGDDGPATAARLDSPKGLAVDAAGNLYIADQNNHRVRRVSADGVIRTVAGNGTAGSTGDGGAALSAQLSSPSGITLDAAGNLYIADTENHRVRKVSPAGILTTVAGAAGGGGYNGDNALATTLLLNRPTDVAVRGLYILRTPKITVFAASGPMGS